MGTGQSRRAEFYHDNAIYHACIDSIETNSSTEVYRKILQHNLSTLKQMQAVGIIICQKAFTNPELSLKCAQLVKLLETKSFVRDNQIIDFHTVFSDHFLNFLRYCVDNHDDKKLNEPLIQHGKNIALFFGNLYMMNFYMLESVVELARIVKEKETLKSQFFMETIYDVIKQKLATENIPFEIFQLLTTKNAIFDRNGSSGSKTQSEFCDFLAKIRDKNQYEFYENFDKVASADIKVLFSHAATKENFQNVYRDISMELIKFSHNETFTQLDLLFTEKIKNYKAIKDLGSAKNVWKCEHLSALIVEFYNTGLINDEIVENFLNLAKSPKLPTKIFSSTFINTLWYHPINFIPALHQDDGQSKMMSNQQTKPHENQGSNLINYFEDLEKIAANDPELNEIVAAVDEYIRGRESSKGKKSKKKKIPTGLFIADLPDFRQYSTNCITMATAFMPNNSQNRPQFTCEARPSCHFSSLRGIEILKRHIGNKFFTPERIEICSKMTKKSLQAQSEEVVGHGFEREMKTYLRYFQKDIEPPRKVENFSNLIASMYKLDILKHKAVHEWMMLIFESIKNKQHKLYGKILKIYSDFFDNISNKFLKDDPYLWSKHLKFIEDFEVRISGFVDYEKFKDNFKDFDCDMNAFNSISLKNVKIPKNKISMKMATKYLIRQYLDEKLTAPAVPIIFNLLVTQFDKIALRSVIEDTLCQEMGFLCSCCYHFGGKFHEDSKSIVILIESLCAKMVVSRLGLANILNIAADMITRNSLPMLTFATLMLKRFFTGMPPLDVKVENIIFEVICKMKKEQRNSEDDYSRIREAIKALENVLESSRQKRNGTVMNGSGSAKVENLKHSQNGNLQPKITEPKSLNKTSSELPELAGPAMKNSQKTENKENLVPVTSNKTTEQPAPPPKLSIDDIKDYRDFCEYYDSITSKSKEIDKEIFNPVFFSTIKITKKEQIVDFAKKFVERVLAGESPVLFFVQSALKIGNIVQNSFKAKNQKVSFQKVLLDEIFSKFKNEKILLKFFCELYNQNYVSKSSMIAFVDKFMSQSPENLDLLHIFVKKCAIKLATQGDKEQLINIREIGKSAKNLQSFDENLKFLIQDLVNSTNFLISLLESGQSKSQNLYEDPEKIVSDLVKNVLKNPQIYVKTASKLEGKLKELLIQKMENILSEIPEISIKYEEFKNLLEFIAELYNSEFLKNDFINFTVEIFLKTSATEISSKSVEFLFEKCGEKMENVNKQKFDLYMNFFEAVLAENDVTVRAEPYKNIIKLRNKKWKNLNIPENFYEDFLMLYSINDAKVDEIVEIFNVDEEEIDKFIRYLWKILLKDPLHPSHSILCAEISKFCENFNQKLANFITARCATFIGLDSACFDENVKQRLGKVVTFVAEIYSKNLASDEILEMWMDEKLTTKIPAEFVARIFSTLSSCERLEASGNEELKGLVKKFDEIYYRGMDDQINFIIKELNSINRNVN